MLTVFGNIGRDAELRYTQNGMAVCSVPVAYNYGMKDPNTGYKPSQWVECTLWGKQAEALAQYLVKGQQVHVSIRDLHIEEFTKNDQSKGFKLTGTVAEIVFARGDGKAQPSAAQEQPQQQPVQPPKGYPQGYQLPQDKQQNNQNSFNDEFSDNIPF